MKGYLYLNDFKVNRSFNNHTLVNVWEIKMNKLNPHKVKFKVKKNYYLCHVKITKNNKEEGNIVGVFVLTNQFHGIVLTIVYIRNKLKTNHLN